MADRRLPVNVASRRRLVVLYVVAAAMLISLGGRLWYVQVMNNTAFTKLAAQNQTRDLLVPAVRGQILDDVGNQLVTNQTALVVSVDMMTVSQQPDGGAAVLHRLSRLLGMSYKVLSEKVRLCTKGVSQPCWAGSPYQPIPVDQNASDRVALQVLEEQKEYPGVTAQVQPVVDYPEPYGANPAQVLGYLQPITPQEIKSRHLSVTGFSGVDLVGQTGLEAEYDSQLRGTPGNQVVYVNAAGDVTGQGGETQPTNGDDLVTSLNAPLQADVQQVLADAVAKSRAEGNTGANQGAAIVMTTTGRVVAMASYPDYNPSVWTGGISQPEFDKLTNPSDGEPLNNWATQGEYAPGSTWKITSTAAAVADGYSLDGLYNCPASVSIDGQTFKNDGEPNLGDMTLAEALIQSCDTVFYDLGYDMYLTDDTRANDVTSPKAPVQKMQKMELDWGFGQSTGVDLPAESLGSVPTREWLYYLYKDNAHTGQDWCKNGKEFGTYVQQIEWQDCQSGNVWEPGQAAIAAIGQGYVSVTPIQLADAYAALANGGTLYSPRIGEALVSPDGKVVQQINPPVIRHLPVSSYTLSYIRNALAGVVTEGTAAGAFSGFPLNKVCVAGKTGTAQLFGKNATSVFASFAPCNDPKYVVLVMVPDSGYGADVAAPAVRTIWDDIYGLEGHKAALPGGQVPSSLPQILPTGAINAPAGYGTPVGNGSNGTKGGKGGRS
jgi:penicillin-binding protein 2